MIRQVKSETPDAEFASAFLQQVGTESQIIQLGMYTPGRIAFSTTYRFDGTGTLLKGPQADRGPGLWILGALQPLHFGWFAGVPVKLLYGLLGLALSIVTHSGVAVWLARRRDKGRPAPRWERAWAAVVWSQPLAFGTTATVALLAGEGLLIETYLATVAAAAGLAGLGRDARTASHLLRLACTFGLLTAVSAHALRWRGHAIDPTAWYVDVALLVVAIAILLPVLARRRAAGDAAQNV